MTSAAPPQAASSPSSSPTSWPSSWSASSAAIWRHNVMARMVTPRRVAISTIGAWLAGFLIFFPILWMVLASFKAELRALAVVAVVVFFDSDDDNYATVQARGRYYHLALNRIVHAGA